uniref:Reverse transcriptase domain-containing protein n=1 Tax=Trichogramma kaykai TaxID=54128 RepID=A0ABD2WZD3_9HYME
MNDLINYNKRTAETKKLFRSKKRNCFRKFAENLNFRVNPTYVWNHCKILKNSILNIKAPHLSDYLQPDSDISSTLDKITPPWAPTDPSYMPDCQRNDFLDSHFTFLEFNIALEQKNDRSAPGLDGISFEILKKLPINYKLLLLDLFNQMFSQSTFPDAWREAYVHFIRKAEGRGYRPISLTSCSCKLFETMLKGSLQWWAESGKWLPSSQHGFRKSNSCSDNLANLTVTIESAFKEGLEIYAAFVDIEGAFDKVNIDLLLKKLATKGASLRVVSFVKFATAERFIFTDSNKKDCTVAHKGLPQGAVLSPLLHAIYAASITDNLPPDVFASCFADDVAIYTISDPHSNKLATLEEAIHTLDSNITNIALSIAPKKSKFMHFHNSNFKPGDKQIKIKSHSIKSVGNNRFLGIILDHKLTFDRHITHIHKRCMASLNIIKSWLEPGGGLTLKLFF